MKYRAVFDTVLSKYVNRPTGGLLEGERGRLSTYHFAKSQSAAQRVGSWKEDRASHGILNGPYHFRRLFPPTNILFGTLRVPAGQSGGLEPCDTA